MAEAICSGCTKPITAGEPRYTLFEPEVFWHYWCWCETDKAKVAAGVDEAVSGLLKRKWKRARGWYRKTADGRSPDGFLCEGWRLVRKGGIVHFGRLRHQHDALRAKG